MAYKNTDKEVSVSDILKKCYLKSPEVEGLKITTHKSKLTSFVEDPLLWVRLSPSVRQTSELSVAPPDSIKGAIHPNGIKKRLELLEDALKRKHPDLARLTSDEKAMEHLFSDFFESGSDIISWVDTTPRCIGDLEVIDEYPVISGVVTELYRTKDGDWNGFVTSYPHKGQKGQVIPAKGYRFDHTSPDVLDHQLDTYPLHIGDEVSFGAVNGDWDCSVAPGTLQVVRYNTCLKEEFVSRYFEWILSTENDPLQCLTKLLDWPAPWMSVLNEEALYNVYYPQVLQVYDICASESEMNVVPRIKQELMNTFYDTQFILNIHRIVDITIKERQNVSMDQGGINAKDYVAMAMAGQGSCDANNLDLGHTPTGTGEGAPGAANNGDDKKIDTSITEVHDSLNIAINLVGAVIRLKKEVNSHSLAGAITEVGKLLMVSKEVDLMHTLLVSLVDTHMVPMTPSTTASRTWHHVPTIPTNDEFQKVIKNFEDKTSPHLDLPEVKNRYSTVAEYGHTYFSLLRADCYYPLCEKIARLKERTGGIKDSYYEMTFQGLFPSPIQPVLFQFGFKAVSSQNTQADDSPSLTSGNLLCISLDGGFERDFIWATVEYVDNIRTNVKDKQLKEGVLSIQLCSDFNTLPDELCMELFSRSRNIVAVESPAYFRAYQPVLDALKELDFSKLHFIDDFMFPTPNPKCTCDLQTSELDPTPLYKTGGLKTSELDPTPPYKTGGLAKVTVQKLIADLESPDQCTLKVDPSQRDAICQSLTKSISLIQGPPGTGKTYVGTKLMQLFLSLSSLSKDKPILIMAFRNRALDHFLKKCLKFIAPKDVVRVGHSSDDYVELVPLMLNSRVKEMETSKIRKIKSSLITLSEKITEAGNNIMKKSQLTLENSREHMTADWLKSLLRGDSQTWVSERIKKMLKDTDRCIRLLKAKGMMGKQDSEDRDELNLAVEQAWQEWSKGINHVQSDTTGLKSQCQGIEDLSDMSDIKEELEWERNMASDEEDIEGKCLGNCCQFTDIFEDSDQKVSERDVWGLSDEQRRKLITKAIKMGYFTAIENLKCYFRMYNQKLKKYESEKCRLQLKVLRRAKIVGMTTTWAAINQQLLNELKASVVFVEEAAEVLESNLLATLTPHVKHLILIGDHLQLKPKVSFNYLKKKDFDKSLFQRLLENGYPYILLMNQSRMMPEMVKLYSHQYKEQKKESGGEIQSNKEIINKIKKLNCMESSVFWWNHNNLESSLGSGVVRNDHEVKMVVSLCLWILSNEDMDGIGKDDIAVLTPYRSQVRAIKKGLEDKSNSFKSSELCEVTTALSQINVFTVDEFQGHEAKVIILSLVRSNPKGSIGFLSDRSRQVVAVSRQKCGLYIVGDSKCLKDNSPFVWKPFIENRVKDDLIRDVITVHCGTVGNKVPCKTPEDLEKLVTGPLPYGSLEASSPVRGTDQPVPPIRQQSSASPVPITSPTSLGPNDVTNATLDKVVSDEVIMDLVNSSAVKNWKFVGRRLGLGDPTINSLEREHSKDLDEQFYQMMLKWKQIDGDKATYGKLFQVLIKCKLKDVVDQIKQSENL